MNDKRTEDTDAIKLLKADPIIQRGNDAAARLMRTNRRNIHNTLAEAECLCANAALIIKHAMLVSPPDTPDMTRFLTQFVENLTAAGDGMAPPHIRPDGTPLPAEYRKSDVA